MTITNCKEYYTEIFTQCGNNLTASFDKDNELCTISHHFILDYEIWIKALSKRPEVDLLKMALREYHNSLLALLIGQYRQAFMELRLFLELSLGTVYFSGNELDFRVWERNQKDISWNVLINAEKGIFSNYFIKAFYEDLTEEAVPHRVMAEKVYRECSEYVHGNAYTHTKISDKLEFMDEIFLDWHEKAKTVRQIVTFALCSRYLNFFDKDSLSSLEPIIIDELGYIDTIRLFFDRIVEAE